MKIADHADKLLARLREYYDAYGVLPSYTLMAALIDVNAKSWVCQVVKNLEGSGYLARTPMGQLMPGRKFNEDLVRADDD